MENAEVAVAAPTLLFNVPMTVLKGHELVISNILPLGLWALARPFSFFFYNPANLSVDKMLCWCVVHLWIGGFGELIIGSILAVLML